MTAATTLAAFAGQRAGNYCTLPTIDVPILADVRLCNACDREVVHRPHPKGVGWGLGRWVHEGGDSGDGPTHYVSARPRCRYCRSNAAVYRQHAWFDAVECARCGGVDGFAIGD